MVLCVHTQTQTQTDTDTDIHRQTQRHRHSQTDTVRHYTHTHTYSYICAHQYQHTARMDATARVSALCCSRGTHMTRGVLWVVMCALTSNSFSLHLSFFVSLSLAPLPSCQHSQKLSGASAARGGCCTKFCDVQAFSREVGDSFLPRYAQRPASVAVRRLYQYHRLSPCVLYQSLQNRVAHSPDNFTPELTHQNTILVSRHAHSIIILPAIEVFEGLLSSSAPYGHQCRHSH